jgi:two-component system cell cycle response regulator
MWRADPAELVALSDRWRYLSVWRVAFALLVGGAALAGDGAAVGVVVAGSGAYLVATGAVALAWHRVRRRGLALHGLALCLDAALVALATTAAGAADAAAAVAVLHVVAVSLLASHRSGIRIAGLLTIAIAVARDQAAQGAFPWGDDVDAAGAVAAVLLIAIWVAAVVTGSMSAANERELRRRRHDLEQLNTLARALATARTAPDVAERLMDALTDHLDVRAAVLVGLHDGEATLLGRCGTPHDGPAPAPIGPDGVLAAALADGRALLVERFGPADAWLDAALPGAHGIVVVPLPARERHGALVLDTGLGRLDRRVALTLEQYAAAVAGALDAVTLLDRAVTLASTDPLTGIANRRTFEATLARALRESEARGARFGLVVLDIDHFKRVNDTHGHDIGDRVLGAVGRLLAGTCRASDTPARIGGEEFAVLVREAAPDDAVRFAHRLCAEFPGCDPLEPTASLGVAVADGIRTTPTAMLKAADEALYRAKAAGRNRVEIAAAPPGGPLEKPPAEAPPAEAPPASAVATASAIATAVAAAASGVAAATGEPTRR